jgi:hypothetical protein
MTSKPCSPCQPATAQEEHQHAMGRSSTEKSTHARAKSMQVEACTNLSTRNPTVQEATEI